MNGRERTCVLGVDAGGTNISLAAVGAEGDSLFRLDADSHSYDGDKMMESLSEIVMRGLATASDGKLRVKAVGVGAAGFVLYEEGLMLGAPNIAWSMVPIKKILESRTKLPVFVDNDANAAALGEGLAGVCRGVDDFVYLTLGTGIGGGICQGGRIYRGHRGTAAEIGHMVVEPEGPRCGCGNRGCLEVLASGTALVREAVRLVLENRESLLYEMCRGIVETITGKMVSEAAAKGDGVAMSAFGRMSYYLGIGIVNLIHLFDPEVVALGGGVSQSGSLFIESVREVVAERGIPACVQGTRIEISTLHRDAGVIGAAALAWEGIGRAP